MVESFCDSFGHEAMVRIKELVAGVPIPSRGAPKLPRSKLCANDAMPPDAMPRHELLVRRADGPRYLHIRDVGDLNLIAVPVSG
jgi:hypothetical protein